MNGPDPSQLQTAATVWSIRVAMVCLAAVLCWWICRRVEPVSTAPLTVRMLWMIGGLMSLAHGIAAMAFYHHWSHQAAWADTARQTEELLGIPIGVGIYFNYLFVIVWMIDALWWMVKPCEYASRDNWINWSVYGFLIFIAINGTIIFETGPTRYLAITATIGLISLWIRREWIRRGGD